MEDAEEMQQANRYGRDTVKEMDALDMGEVVTSSNYKVR